MVASLLWFAVTSSWVASDSGDVGCHRADNAEILQHFEVGILFTCAISALGELCNFVECRNSDTKLTERVYDRVLTKHRGNHTQK